MDSWVLPARTLGWDVPSFNEGVVTSAGDHIFTPAVKTVRYMPKEHPCAYVTEFTVKDNKVHVSATVWKNAELVLAKAEESVLAKGA